MKLEIESDGINLKEYVCELTKELDKLSGIDKAEYYEWHHHYLLVAGWHTKENYMAIRVPGGTVGLIEYDDDFKITKLKVDTDYVVKTYPKNVNEIIQKYIGVKVEFKEDGIYG